MAVVVVPKIKFTKARNSSGVDAVLFFRILHYFLSTAGRTEVYKLLAMCALMSGHLPQEMQKATVVLHVVKS